MTINKIGAVIVGAALFVGISAQATELQYFQTFTNVDYASASVGGLRQVGMGTIQLNNVTGTVKKAYLYWHGHLDSSGYVAARTTGTVTVVTPQLTSRVVTGQLIGTSGPDGWCCFKDHIFDLRYGQAFRADVTDLVSGSGNYTLGQFNPFNGGSLFDPVPLVQGASLIVIYDDGDPDNNNDIIIQNGCDQNSASGSFDALGWNVNFPSFNYHQGDGVEMEFHVSDGQRQYLEGALYLNDQFLAPIDGAVTAPNGKVYGQIFDGSAPWGATSGFDDNFFQGSLWDVKSFNIVPTLMEGPNNLYITADFIDDDLTLIVLVAKLKTGGVIDGSVPNVRPTITCSGSANYSCLTPNTLLTNILQATVSDANGDELTVIWNDVNNNVVQSTTIPAGVSSSPTVVLLTNIVTVTAEGASYTFGVTVRDSKGAELTCANGFSFMADSTPPIILNCAPDTTATADSTGQAVVPNLLNQVTASDNCTPAGSLVYSQNPAAGTVVNAGTNNITFTVTDASGNASTCSTSFTVLPLNRPPVANPDSTSTGYGEPVAITVLQNDFDPDNDTVSVISHTTSANGTVVFDAESELFVFTPATGFSGTTTFQYTISDGKSGTSTTTVTIVVKAPVAPPAAGNFTTFTQGGWGSSPSGNNPGMLLKNNFSRVYPNGVTIGGTYTLTFTSAAAVEAFLPQGGSASALKKSQTNPTSKVSVLAGQILALQLSVSCSASGVTKGGLGELHLASGKLAGKTVNEFLTLANKVLGGTTSCLPSGVTLSDLNNIATALNENYDNGTTNKGYLKP